MEMIQTVCHVSVNLPQAIIDFIEQNQFEIITLDSDYVYLVLSDKSEKIDIIIPKYCQYISHIRGMVDVLWLFLCTS